MLTVACVLRSGGKFDSEYVRKLRDGVLRFANVPHRFVCLSDVDVPCERIPLEHNWPGWWSKIELFRPGVIKAPMLYLDLDTIVIGSLYQDFLPASWGYFKPTWVDICTYLGTFGLFFTCFLLFIRFLPLVAISEVKGVTPQADPHHPLARGNGNGGSH